MDIDYYQQQATETIQFDINEQKGKYITLMGLTGEVGELATEYKKQLRDGEGYTVFKEKLVEELGDILWYLSAIAEHENLRLSEIATKNLNKTFDRWGSVSSHSLLIPFDDKLPIEQQLPRKFWVKFEDIVIENRNYISLSWNEGQFGDPLRDNSYDDDFYRFHDIFHLSYAVVLGWSPVVRKLTGRKRKGYSQMDEVEDGGRAIVIDEAISSLVFEYARKHCFFEHSTGVDYPLLRTIKELTKHLEVSERTGKDWEKAILLGFEHWRNLKEHNGGIIQCDLDTRNMQFQPNK
mgnify:CR=1 FL=1